MDPQEGKGEEAYSFSPDSRANVVKAITHHLKGVAGLMAPAGCVCKRGPRLKRAGGPSGTLVSSSLPGTFLRPSLRAEPSSVVPQGTPVRLWCRGSPTAHLFTLRKAGPGGYADIYMVIPPAVGMEAEFLLSSVTASDGGLYKCCYRSPSGGSEDSEPLQLAVTGYYNRPRLSAEPRN
ncbi:leukocyte immunoglobulin-like receptor subfamily A member 6 [Monodelphis domestica]|uniref:leukocyte immunoglobulin-like receptor subfamily A member 6 n=1 Tax=Monodelphis domestica TaxID=13616 RepID=UPI0024E21678|nr:leukocyte immunoglobulin-like receptor subfamily A member 6 [Monodelphis domestica]